MNRLTWSRWSRAGSAGVINLSSFPPSRPTMQFLSTAMWLSYFWDSQWYWVAWWATLFWWIYNLSCCISLFGFALVPPEWARGIQREFKLSMRSLAFFLPLRMRRLLTGSVFDPLPVENVFSAASRLASSHAQTCAHWQRCYDLWKHGTVRYP